MQTQEQIKQAIIAMLTELGNKSAKELGDLLIDNGFQLEANNHKTKKLHQAISGLKRAGVIINVGGLWQLDTETPETEPKRKQSKPKAKAKPAPETNTDVSVDVETDDSGDSNQGDDNGIEWVETETTTGKGIAYASFIIGVDLATNNRSSARIRNGDGYTVVNSPLKDKKFEDPRQAVIYAKHSITQALIGKKPLNMKPRTKDTELIDKIRDKFDAVSELAHQVCKGGLRSLIVAGAPGVGKTYCVERVTDDWKAHLFEQGKDGDAMVGILTGRISTYQLFKRLYDYRHKGCVLVLDDIDSIYRDIDSMNILKAASDSKVKRRVQYHSAAPEAEGLPNAFDFYGNIIFITNIDIDEAKGEAKKHLEALHDRAFYYSVQNFSVEDRIARIKGVVEDSDIMKTEGVTTKHGEKAVMDFLLDNAKKIRLTNLSLRGLQKACVIYKMVYENLDAPAIDTPVDPKFYKRASQVLFG